MITNPSHTISSWRKKKRRGIGTSSEGGVFRQPDCLAGDAVLIAPVSKQIPWYQGILQGILQFWGAESRFRSNKPLCCSQFLNNSLLKLTGKIFRGTGNFWPVTGNLRGRLVSVHFLHACVFA